MRSSLLADNFCMLNDNNSTARWHDFFALVLLAPALVAGCWSVDFIGYDDAAHYEHELLSKSTPLNSLFNATENSTYFPITIISYRFDKFINEHLISALWPRAGDAPFVRLHSLFSHVLAAFFLWRALLCLKLGRWLSLFAAAGWMLHPAACESVCWISERKNVLSALFGFASLWVWFNTELKKLPRLAGTGILFALAILSKPTAAGFVPVYIVYELLMRRDVERDAPVTRWPKWLPSSLLFVLMVVVIVLLAKLNLVKTDQAYVQVAGGNHFYAALTDVPILVQYIYNSILPVSLSIFYYNPIVRSVIDPMFLISLAILAALFAGSYYLSTYRLRTLFLWGWFIGALGPALNIIPLPYLMQDRFAYCSLPAILIIFAESAAALYVRAVPRFSPELPKIASYLVPVLLAILSLFRSDVYRNDFELFKDAIEKQPQSAYAQQFYGLTLAETADRLELSDGANKATLDSLRSEALKHLELSLKCPDADRLLEPGRVRILIAVQYERLGNSAVALPLLIEELKRPLRPYNSVIGYLSLARIQLAAGNSELALTYVDLAIRSSAGGSSSAELTYFKALCLEKLGRLDEARQLYQNVPENSFTFKRAVERLKLLNQ